MRATSILSNGDPIVEPPKVKSLIKKPHFCENHHFVMLTHGLIMLSIKQGMHSSLISCNLYNNPMT